jgi:drug/metabolite transporter (DMT)-like permease
LIAGVLFALGAGLLWGLVFVAPLLLKDYPPALLTFGRYLAFGLVALPLAWLDRGRLRQLARADWLEALKLAAVGNVVYYLCLSAAIQRCGAPLPTMLIGTLPVVMAVATHWRSRRPLLGPAGAQAALTVTDPALDWRQLAPAVLLMAAGVALVNQSEWQHLQQQAQTDWVGYSLGALLALVAVACWTWYPLRNADWLRHHPERSPTTWATAQGLATLPLALLGYAAWWIYSSAIQDNAGSVFVMPLGPDPMRFVALMLALGLLASWLGTLCWNEASQRLPTRVAGPLIVFETLSALAYAWVLRGQWPSVPVLLGVVLLVVGVAWGVTRKPAANHLKS